MFEKMVEEYNYKSKSFWNNNLNREKNLTNKEAEDMNK